MCLVVSGFVISVAASVVNVNLFSMNAMYANRLTRAFLGASRPTDASWSAGIPTHETSALGVPTGSIANPRDPNPVTEFDPDDDLELAALRIGEAATGQRTGPSRRLQHQHEPCRRQRARLRDRKAESFILTPLHCGAGRRDTPRPRNTPS